MAAVDAVSEGTELEADGFGVEGTVLFGDKAPPG